MKRLLCGSVVLAASFGVVSCNGDPTSDFRNGPDRILAEPSTVFLPQGTQDAVTFTLVDQAGDPLAGDFECSTGTGITVERNEEFLPTTTGVPLESQAQCIVTAGDVPQATSFTVTAGGLSLEIPVRITPTSLAATFSNVTPAMNEPVTITAEGYSFLPTAAVSFAGDSAIILSIAGSSLTFLPDPGASGPALVEGIAISFLPTTALSLETTEEITVPPLAAVGGTDDPATAPELPVPPVGETSGFFDAPDFVATIDHFYKLTVTEAGTYTITLDWNIGTDIDLFLCENPPAADFSNCPFFSFTGHPEEVGADLTPGTYFVVAEDFEGDAAGTRLQTTVQHAAPTSAVSLRKSASNDSRKLRKLQQKP